MKRSYEKLHEVNNQNFTEFLELLGNYDPVMKEHIRRIKSTEVHNDYFGEGIQNKIIQLLSNKLKFHIGSTNGTKSCTVLFNSIFLHQLCNSRVVHLRQVWNTSCATQKLCTCISCATPVVQLSCQQR